MKNSMSILYGVSIFLTKQSNWFVFLSKEEWQWLFYFFLFSNNFIIDIKRFLLDIVNVFIRRSYLCLFTSFINTNWIYFQRFSSCEFQSMVININWFSFCINNNCSYLSYISQCNSKVEQILLSIFFNLLCIRYVHIATFIWCFSYLLFFRTTNLFSIRLPVAHSNAIQLMLTLKVCVLLK